MKVSARDFPWTEDMDEISGFGGSYESTCRWMVSCGTAWLAENPDRKPVFSGFTNITGIIIEDNDDAKALSKIVEDAAGGDCTGAMHQFSILHALHANKVGWPEYQRLMRERRQSGKEQA